MCTIPPKPMKRRKRSDLVECSLPVDIGLKIVSSLEAADVCSLASCSRFWREVCGHDCVWEPLCRDRWGATDSMDQEHTRLKGWREFYMKKHKGIAAQVENKLAGYLQQLSFFGYVEGIHYLKALRELIGMHLPFKEVEFVFFKSNIPVLLKLVALHYCVRLLPLQAESIREMLIRCNMVNNRICIQWSKAKKCRSFYHFVTCPFGELLIQHDGYDLNYLGRAEFNTSLKVKISAA